jgi:hypothetical protein
MGASEWGKPPTALKGKRGRERRRYRMITLKKCQHVTGIKNVKSTQAI